MRTGPVLGWINVIEAHRKTHTELPVNLKMVFEGMEESGSEGLEELVASEAKKFLAGVDAVCISDNYWLGTRVPCLTYGTPLYFFGSCMRKADPVYSRSSRNGLLSSNRLYRSSIRSSLGYLWWQCTW